MTKEDTYFPDAAEKFIKAISESGECKMTKEEFFNFYRIQYNE